MNKKIAFLALGLLIGIVGYSHAASLREGGWEVARVDGSTVQVFTGSGFLRLIIASTGTPSGDINTKNEWFAAIDSVALQSNTYSAYNATQCITPPVFMSTTSYVAYPPANVFGENQWDYLKIYKGLFIFKTPGISAPVWVYYKR